MKSEFFDPNSKLSYALMSTISGHDCNQPPYDRWLQLCQDGYLARFIEAIIKSAAFRNVLAHSTEEASSLRAAECYYRHHYQNDSPLIRAVYEQKSETVSKRKSHLYRPQYNAGGIYVGFYALAGIYYTCMCT